MSKLLVSLAIASAMLLAGGVYIMSEQSEVLPSNATTVLFESWKQEHSKSYKSDSEEIYRRTVFHQNVQKINTHNGSGASYTMAVNQFADLTAQEFKNTYLGANISSTSSKNFKYLPEVDTASVDWRTKGAVTGVKNQAQCGSCWAFSTTGSLEGGFFLKTGKLVSMSEQLLVGCSKEGGNAGCNGGLMDNAFQYVEKNGMESESDYPYPWLFHTGCKYNKAKVIPGFSLKGYSDVPKNDSDQLKAAVDKQPISIAMDAESLQMYSSGIFNNKNCGTQLDHGILIVGYGEEDSKKFWIVKNSWGASWGEKGYFRITRSEGKGVGMCGLTESASYPNF